METLTRSQENIPNLDVGLFCDLAAGLAARSRLERWAVNLNGSWAGASWAELLAPLWVWERQEQLVAGWARL